MKSFNFRVKTSIKFRAGQNMVLTHEMIWYIKWNEMVPPKWNDKSNQLLKILNEYDNWDQASHVSWRHDSKEIK